MQPLLIQLHVFIDLGASKGAGLFEIDLISVTIYCQYDCLEQG